MRGDAEVPITLFDSIAENLLQNALSKRQREDGVEILAKFTVDRNRPLFSVCDTGEAIAPAIAESLFQSPVHSAFGMGIGLYHAARQAEDSGYTLKLEENRAGAVTFTLTTRN